MAIHRTPKSGLFLLEMVLLILFFSIASAVCVNLFVKAHIISGQNRDLNEAVRQVQSAAETYKAVDGDLERLAALLEMTDNGDSCQAWFDENWLPLHSEQGARYNLSLIPGEEENGLIEASVVMRGAASEGSGLVWQDIYGIEVKKYLD